PDVHVCLRLARPFPALLIISRCGSKEREQRHGREIFQAECEALNDAKAVVSIGVYLLERNRDVMRVMQTAPHEVDGIATEGKECTRCDNVLVFMPWRRRRQPPRVVGPPGARWRQRPAPEEPRVTKRFERVRRQNQRVRKWRVRVGM